MNTYARELHDFYNEIKSRLAVTKWQLAVFLAIFAAVLWMANVEKSTKTEQQNYLVQPKKGDIYKFRLEKNYSTLMVVDVSPDSVTVYPNQYESKKRRQLGVIDKPENYMFLPMSFSKDELSAMYKSGTIYEIDR